MPKNKPLPTSAPKSIETSWINGNEVEMIDAIVRKYARVLDMTDSGRDIKPLVTGMFEAVDRLHALKAAQGAENNTPLADILAEAEAMLANV